MKKPHRPQFTGHPFAQQPQQQSQRSLFRPGVVQPKSAPPPIVVRQSVAPPVYRPQPVPKVMQRKTAPGQPPQTGQSNLKQATPPAHRPEQKRIAQPKMGVATPPQKMPPAVAPVKSTPPDPRLTRPNPLAAATPPHANHAGHPNACGKNACLQLKGVIQRVGGTKVGLRPENSGNTSDPALLQVGTIFSTYKQEVKTFKQQAKATFTGREANHNAQSIYARNLARAEIDVTELKARINRTTELEVGNDNIIKKKGTSDAVAHILTRNTAYQQMNAPTDDTPHGIFKKFKLEVGLIGLSDTDYIQVQGRMLRRYAYRGITAMEIPQIEAGGMVRPVYHTDESRRKNKSGVHFQNGIGYKRKKTPDKLDLSYIRELAPTVQDLIPNMYAFAQARRGAGKFFSFRSTPGDITSNHGYSFAQSGEIRIDLAKVDPNSFVFHYADSGASTLNSGIPAHLISPHRQQRHNDEVLRARESLLRNREIILKEYPASAVTWTKQPVIPSDQEFRRQGFTDGRKGKNVKFALRQNIYDEGYAAGMRDMGREHGQADGSRGAPHQYGRNNTDYQDGYDGAYDIAYGFWAYDEGRQDGKDDGYRAVAKHYRLNHANYRVGYDSGYSNSRGYRHGRDDARNGNRRNYAENNHDYRDGYDDGYDEGQRDRGKKRKF